MERYFRIGIANLRFNLYPNLLLSILLLGISPFLLGIDNLDRVRTAQVLEMYVALLGIILLTPVFLPEQNSDIKDLVESKYTSVNVVYLIRIIEAILSLIVLIGIYILILKHNNCDFPALNYYIGTLAEAFFLGGMGLCAYSIFNQIAIGYMLPMVYYMISFGGGSKLLKSFYLFSLRYEGYSEKVYLAIIGFLCVILAISYQSMVKRIRSNKWISF